MKPRSFRARMVHRQWRCVLYADMTVATPLEHAGPFATCADAEAHGEALGLPNGDKSDAKKGRALP